MLVEVTNSAPELPNHFTTPSVTSDLGYICSNNISNLLSNSEPNPKADSSWRIFWCAFKRLTEHSRSRAVINTAGRQVTRTASNFSISLNKLHIRNQRSSRSFRAPHQSQELTWAHSYGDHTTFCMLLHYCSNFKDLSNKMIS